MKFAQHPVRIKKEITSFTVIATAVFHPPVVKNVVLKNVNRLLGEISIFRNAEK